MGRRIINRMGCVKLLFFRWAVLHPILSGILGKSTFVISLALPLSKLVKIGFELSGYHYLLAGAMSVTIAFILNRIFAPEIIKEFLSPSKYASHLVKRDNEKTLDFTGEFEFLNDYQTSQISHEIKNDIEEIKQFLPIHKGKQILGNKRAIYKFSEAKFKIIDKSKYILRGILTFLFFIGIFFLYLPTFKAILIIFKVPGY